MKALLLAACFVWMEPCYAEDYVCSDGAGKFVQYLHSYGRLPSDPNCVQVPEGKIPAQLDLIRQVPQKYLTLSGTLAAEMSQVDKDIVDAAEQASAQAVADADTARLAARQKAKDDLLAHGLTRETVDVVLP